MDEWLTGTWIGRLTGTGLIDLVIAATVAEALWLTWHHRATGEGVAPREFALNMASGLCLMVALRCVAGGAGLQWVALCLLAAGACHAADIARRWKRRAAHRVLT